MHMRCLWSQQRCWGLLHTYQPHPAAPASADACACLLCRGPTYDLNRIPGPWRTAKPVVGNVLECLRPDFHRVVLGWADKYGGIVRVKFLWRDALVVTDPAALAVIMGRGEGALDKAAGVYSPINYMCDPHGQPNLLTSAADGQWKAIRKAVAVSFSIQNIKKKYPLVLGKVNQLLGRLAAQGSCTAVDVDQAALRVTLDVIGLVSGGIWGAGGGGWSQKASGTQCGGSSSAQSAWGHQHAAAAAAVQAIFAGPAGTACFTCNSQQQRQAQGNAAVWTVLQIVHTISTCMLYAAASSATQAAAARL